MANKGRSGVSEVLGKPLSVQWASRVRGAFFPGHRSRFLPSASLVAAGGLQETGSGTSQKDPLNQDSQQAGENTRCAIRASTQCPARLCRWRHCGGGSTAGGWGPLSAPRQAVPGQQVLGPRPSGAWPGNPQMQGRLASLRDAHQVGGGEGRLVVPSLCSVPLNGTLAFPKPLPSCPSSPLNCPLSPPPATLALLSLPPTSQAQPCLRTFALPAPST